MRVTGKPPSRRAGDDLGRGGVDDRQTLQHAPFRRPVEDEIRRTTARSAPAAGPAAGGRPPGPSSVAAASLAAAPPHRGGRPACDDDAALLAHLQIDHAGAIAPMPMGQREDAVSQAGVQIGPRHLAQPRRTHAHDRQGAPLAQSLRGHLPHHPAPSRSGHPHVRSTSRVTSFPARRPRAASSAGCFRSQALSAASRRTRSRPPNLLRQR
jgi:hypothetical protein